jgi:hypothetical protein
MAGFERAAANRASRADDELFRRRQSGSHAAAKLHQASHCRVAADNAAAAAHLGDSSLAPDGGDTTAPADRRAVRSLADDALVARSPCAGVQILVCWPLDDHLAIRLRDGAYEALSTEYASAQGQRTRRLHYNRAIEFSGSGRNKCCQSALSFCGDRKSRS